MFNAKKAKDIASNCQLHSLLGHIKAKALSGDYVLTIQRKYCYYDNEDILESLGFKLDMDYEKDTITIRWD